MTQKFSTKRIHFCSARRSHENYCFKCSADALLYLYRLVPAADRPLTNQCCCRCQSVNFKRFFFCCSMRCKKRPLLVQKNCMRSHLDIKRCLPSISLSTISWLRSFSFSVGRKQIDDPNSDADAFNLLHLWMTDDSSCNEQCA